MAGLEGLGLLASSWSRVISVQTQLMERASTLGWISRNFALPQGLTVFVWNSGQTQFKQVRHCDDDCRIESTEAADSLGEVGGNCLEVLDCVQECSLSGVFVLENLQSLMVLPSNAASGDRASREKIVAKLVNIFYDFKVTSEYIKYLLLLGTDEVDLPERLAALVPQVRKPLPTVGEITSFLSQFLPTLYSHSLASEYSEYSEYSEHSEYSEYSEKDVDVDSLSVAASGLTIEEIKIGLWLGMGMNRSTGNQKSLANLLLDYKISRLRGYGLDFVGKPNVPNFGGLDLLKEALQGVKADYSPLAREANIPLPKGWLLVGPPGTGKTLAAKVSARELGFPLISVDVGAVADEGAAYLRRLIDRVEACAPAVVYFDEFDKLFTANSDTGEDAGARGLLGLLLTWLQEKQSPTFVIATLNRLKALPPELTRVGRFDELFYVGFPQAIERKQILSLHATKFDPRYKSGDGPLSESEWKILLGKTVNCNGAELQKIVEKAARKLFHQRLPIEIGLEQLLEQRESITPLYARDPDRVIAIENEAKYVSRPASSEDLSIYAPEVRSFWGESIAKN